MASLLIFKKKSAGAGGGGALAIGVLFQRSNTWALSLTAHSKSNIRAEAWGPAVPFSPAAWEGWEAPALGLSFRGPEPRSQAANPFPGAPDPPRWSSPPQVGGPQPHTAAQPGPALRHRSSSLESQGKLLELGERHREPRLPLHGLVAAAARTPWTTVRRAPATRARSTTTQRR